MERVLDVLVIGGGVSGLSCALYTSKAGLITTVLHDNTSQLKKVKEVWNIPGIETGITGQAWLNSAQQQVEAHGGTVVEAHVESLALETRPYRATTTDGTIFTADYIVLATNLGYSLLEASGFDVDINEHVPSRKIRKLQHVGYDGTTHLPGVYAAGLLADIPSQTAIASGQGAFVGIQIASQRLGKPFMWHD